MHIRKRYLVYPPGYQPNHDRFKVVYSRRQALRALQGHPGSSVAVNILTFPRKHSNWDSSRLDFLSQR